MNTIRLGGEKHPLPLVRAVGATITVGGIGNDVMVCAQFSIYPDAVGGWLADFDDRQAGPYCSHGLVLRVVISEILRVRKLGNDVRLVVKNANGTVRVQHCFCKWFPNCPSPLLRKHD